jgi:hypothetical protein
MRGKAVLNQELALIPCIPDSLIRSLLCFRVIIIIICDCGCSSGSSSSSRSSSSSSSGGGGGDGGGVGSGGNVALNMWALSLKLSSRQSSGSWNSEVAPIFLESLSIPEIVLLV